MYVSGISGARLYILMQEEEDENLFPKTKVYHKVKEFLNCQNQIYENSNCAQQRSEVYIVFEGLRRRLKVNSINYEFLSLAFMFSYKIIEQSYKLQKLRNFIERLME